MLRHLGYPDAGGPRRDGRPRRHRRGRTPRPTTSAAPPARAQFADAIIDRLAGVRRGRDDRAPSEPPPPAQARRAPRQPGSGAPSGSTTGGSRPVVQATLFTICATYLFVSGILLTPLFGTPYEVDGYLSPLFSPLIAPEWPADLAQPGTLHPVGPARLPGHLLLLPQGLLPLLLRRPAGLRRRRADRPQALQDGDGVPVHPPEPPPLLPVPRVHPAVLPVARRGPRGRPRRRASRIGLGVVVLFVNAFLLTGYSLSCHSLRHLVGGRLDCFSCTRRTKVRYTLWQRLTSLNLHHMALGVGEPHLGHPRRRLRPPARDRASSPTRRSASRRRDRDPTTDQSRPQTRPHDVLVIGAGGAGLRAAIEAKAAGADVGLVCKSLLGKAHTVMAEGGVAAALAHVAPADYVAGPLPRHDGRRQAPEQPADGPAPRAGGARPRPRARAVGRGLRPDRRTGGSSSGRSAGTRIRASPTSATGPASR